MPGGVALYVMLLIAFLVHWLYCLWRTLQAPKPREALSELAARGLIVFGIAAIVLDPARTERSALGFAGMAAIFGGLIWEGVALLKHRRRRTPPRSS